MAKKAVIVGASSGIGYEVAVCLLDKGWTVGLAARHLMPFWELRDKYHEQVEYVDIDVTKENAGDVLEHLIAVIGGMDLYINVAGVGWQNMTLEADKELTTVETNALGFTRMVGTAYRWFAAHDGGHIAVLSSIAGTKGLGAAPAYSATKAFDNVYIQALEQQAHLRHLPITFTDIRPGFVRTKLIDDGRSYPMTMDVKKVAKAIVRAIEHHRHICVIDWRWRILTALWRRVPRCLWRVMPISNG